ncbi:MAG: WYL domain-containing transcriptional regulator [Fuerstiella sp.]
MSESPQLVRQWKILQLLEASRRGCAIQELVAEAEVSDKTVRRDIKVLQTVFDITERTGHGGVKRWSMKPLAEQLGFNLTELLSLYLSQQFLEPLAGTPFWEGNRSVFRKIQGALGDNAVRYLQKLSAGIRSTTAGASDYRQRGIMIDRLMVAIEDRKVTLIVYQSMQATEPVEQEVYPLGLVHHRGSLYLIAWSSRREEVRNFKVDRIDEVEPQNLRYEVPEDFDLNTWLSKCFGIWRSGSEHLQKIRVHFCRDAARYVQESTWHESQQFEAQPDGSVIAEFQLPDLQEIKRWIMSFGPGARVLEPPELIDEIAADLTAMQQSYEGVWQ